MAGLADGTALLTAWESAAAAPDVARGTVLLAHDLGRPVEEMLDLPLAECARLALRSNIEAFGELAEVSCACPRCGEVMEALVDMREFLTEQIPDHMTVESDRSLVVRALTTRDLLAVRMEPDPSVMLRRRVLRQPDRELSDTEFAELTASDIAAADQAAEAIAGSASVLLRMRCPSCDSDVDGVLDPAELLWERVAATAPPLLAQVVTLARAFGWSEHDVLGLSEQRRRAYLDLVSEPRLHEAGT